MHFVPQVWHQLRHVQNQFHYRNHGFWQTKEEGKDVGYFGSDQGILRVSAPEKRGGQWKVEPILSGHIGEIATIDIDGDGQDEIMTIEEFHGNTIQIYKKDGSEYKKVWQYDNEIDFAHALVDCCLGCSMVCTNNDVSIIFMYNT